MNSLPVANESVGEEDLRDAREMDRLPKYLSGMWTRRGYAWYVATSNLRSRQMNSLLGNLWHLLNPLLQIGVYFVIFGLVLDVTRGVDNFIAHLAVGVVTYSFIQKSVMAGARSMMKNRGLMQMVTFPRALVPITSTLTEALAVQPAVLVMLFFALVTGEEPSLSWIAVFPVTLAAALAGAGFALIAARAVHHVPDVQNVLPFVFRLGFYASGVLFDIDAYVGDKWYRLVFELNPAYCFIQINRAIVLEGSAMNPRLLLIAAIWTAAIPVVGLLWFRSEEDRYGSK